ncbi:hypothetical protein DW690_16210 [Dorea longicatena]|nr:hypothetical protein DW690_16210 [Dorea longicatena]
MAFDRNTCLCGCIP